MISRQLNCRFTLCAVVVASLGILVRETNSQDVVEYCNRAFQVNCTEPPTGYDKDVCRHPWKASCKEPANLSDNTTEDCNCNYNTILTRQPLCCDVACHRCKQLYRNATTPLISTVKRCTGGMLNNSRKTNGTKSQSRTDILRETTICTCASVIGVIGNLVVIYTHRRKITPDGSAINRGSHSLLISLLAGCDISFALLQATYKVNYFWTDEWLYGEVGCKMIPYLEQSVFLVTIVVLVMISVERYNGLCRPYSKWSQSSLDGRANKYIKLMMLPATVFALLACIPYAQHSNIFIVHVPGSGNSTLPLIQCTSTWEYETEFAYRLVEAIVFILVPWAVMIFMYGSVIRVIFKDLFSRAVDSKKRNKATIKLVAVLILFIGLVVPKYAIKLYMAVVRYRCKWDEHTYFTKDVYTYLRLATETIYPLHIAFNPLIYAGVNIFLMSYFRLVRCCKLHSSGTEERLQLGRSRSRTRTSTKTSVTSITRIKTSLSTSRTSLGGSPTAGRLHLRTESASARNSPGSASQDLLPKKIRESASADAIPLHMRSRSDTSSGQRTGSNTPTGQTSQSSELIPLQQNNTNL